MEEIEKLCSAFLCYGSKMNVKKAKVSSNDICKLKTEGWLSLRPLKEIVCCLKLLWKILSSNYSLWVNWVKKHLIRKGSIWSVKSSQNGSWFWSTKPLARGGHFTRYLNPYPNPIRKTRTEIPTKVAKYPNGYWIMRDWISEPERVITRMDIRR